VSYDWVAAVREETAAARITPLLIEQDNWNVAWRRSRFQKHTHDVFPQRKSRRKFEVAV
jgi:hypothetical protein